MVEEAHEIADYPALRRPRIRAGVGVRSATMIWSLTTMSTLAIGLPWGLLALPVGALVHGGLAWFFKKDPQVMYLYVVHEIVPNNLQAGWPSHGETWVSRPRGYGNGLPLS